MSFWRNYYHLTWGTKNRSPLICPDFEQQLNNYIVKKAAELGVFVYDINGTDDHIHLVVSVPPSKSVAEVVKHLKGSSAHYVNHVILPGVHFGWQAGYGCLTVGEKQRPIAESYVRSQKQHHSEGFTNARLERHTEEDEGPDDMQPGEGSRFVRDGIEKYEELGKFPF
jgi:putative transposase